jgi:twinkle protein
LADIGEVSKQLAQRAEGVASYLLPNGKRVGSEWKAGSVNGESGDSLGVHLSGDKAGVWCDFAGGESGDLIDLWAAVKQISLPDALAQAKAYLGITEPHFDHKPQKKYRKPFPAPGTTKLSDNSPVMEYLIFERKLLPESLTAYQVAERQDGDGNWQVVFPFKRDNERINIKYLNLLRDEDGKKVMILEGGCELCLFGWQAIPEGAREIVICEGELDAVSWFQYGYPALSVPNGAKSDKWIENEFSNLDRFDTIYLSYDEDKDGQAGIPKVVDRLGRHRCRVVHLPVKDCNEALQKQLPVSEISNALLLAESIDPAELKNASVYVEDVIEEFYPSGGVEPGFISPFKKLANRLRFRPAELTVWTGVNGHGKSMVLSQVLLFAALQGERVCVAPTEMPAKKWLKRATRQATCQDYPTKNFIRIAHNWFGQWMWLFTVAGKNKREKIFETFEYARRRYDIKQFVIDSLVKMGFDEDDYNGQKEFVEALADYCIAYDVHIHLVAHLRKSESERQRVDKMKVKGSGAITDLASNVMSIWRNKEKEESMEEVENQTRTLDADLVGEPDAILECHKQRNGDWEGRLPLWFHKLSYQFIDDLDCPPQRYVEEDGADDDDQQPDSEFEVDVNDWVQ